MIQEYYSDDPWKLLISIMLIQRTSGSQRIIFLIKSFFEHFPNPTSIIQVSEDALLDTLAPFGLQQTRMHSMKKFCIDFFEIWKEPKDCFGVGDLGNDSWKIFCLGKWKSTITKQYKLKKYQQWLAKKR